MYSRETEVDSVVVKKILMIFYDLNYIDCFLLAHNVCQLFVLIISQVDSCLHDNPFGECTSLSMLCM